MRLHLARLLFASLAALLASACDVSVPGLSQPTNGPVIVVVTATPASQVATLATAEPEATAAASTESAPASTQVPLPTAPSPSIVPPTAPSAGGTPLCVAGSNSILGGDNAAMTASWTESLAGRFNIQLSISSGGSEAAVEAARAGECIDVLVLSEQLNAGQVQQLAEAGIVAGEPTTFANDAIAFVTNRNNPAPALSLDQISEIVLGEATNWADVGGAQAPITVLLRPGSGTTNYVFSELANFEPFVTEPGQPFPQRLRFAECGRDGGNAACLEQVASTEGAFYWVSRSLVKGDGLRPIPILDTNGAPIDPTGLAFDLQSYPQELVRPLSIYVLSREGGNADTEIAAQTFRAYLLSAPGQQSLIDQGFFSSQ